MSTFRRLLVLGLALAGVVGLAAPAPLLAQAQGQASPLTLDRIFSSREFSPERFGPARWMRDGDAYTTLEPART